MSGDPEDLCASDVPGPHLDQGAVGLLQGKFLDFGPWRDLGGEPGELADVESGDIGDAHDLLPDPEMPGVIERQERILSMSSLRIALTTSCLPRSRFTRASTIGFQAGQYR